MVIVRDNIFPYCYSMNGEQQPRVIYLVISRYQKTFFYVFHHGEGTGAEVKDIA